MNTELPLKGKRVLITRAKEQAKDFANKIEKAGGVAITTPLLQFKANEIGQKLIKETLQKLPTYDCIVFTSGNGVTFFKHFLDQWSIPVSMLKNLKIASVGRKTSQQLDEIGISVTIIPEEFVAERLAKEISSNLSEGAKVLVIHGNLSRPILVETLKSKGFDVTDLVVYETLHNLQEQEKIKKLIFKNQLDFITFTSSSTVDSFMKVLDTSELADHLNKTTFICIGPITYKTLKEYGYEALVPKNYTTDDMLNCMLESLKTKGGY
ncbi:uroporphyrinogen-III synthase [Metabacillus herbersteinensis]|uniref:Uroporphyrinogen-III synthase n=1 Tax=Metabacillus herbersteinensis TaxID=283816 RepID=A0ABV6G9W6_9BACI